MFLLLNVIAFVLFTPGLACTSTIDTAFDPAEPAADLLQTESLPRAQRAAELVIEGPDACARTLEGRVFCWGGNIRMSPAPGCTETIGTRCEIIPLPVGVREPSWIDGLNKVRSIELGGFGAAITENGSVFAWSLHPAHSHKVFQISGIEGATELALGLLWGCATTVKGEVWCWGDPERFSTMDSPGWAEAHLRQGLTDVIDIDADLERTCVVSARGEASCWSGVKRGVLDHGIQQSDQVDVLEISTNRGVTCVRRRDGTLDCWGEDSPTKESLGATKIRQIYLARDWGCASRNAGGLLCWGAPFGRKTVLLQGSAQITDFDIGRDGGCIVVDSGRVHCWSLTQWRNERQRDGKQRPTLRPMRGLQDARSVAVGHLSCALRKGGRIACWGLGYGPHPVDIDIPPH